MQQRVIEIAANFPKLSWLLFTTSLILYILTCLNSELEEFISYPPNDLEALLNPVSFLKILTSALYPGPLFDQALLTLIGVLFVSKFTIQALPTYAHFGVTNMWLLLFINSTRLLFNLNDYMELQNCLIPLMTAWLVQAWLKGDTSKIEGPKTKILVYVWLFINFLFLFSFVFTGLLYGLVLVGLATYSPRVLGINIFEPPLWMQGYRSMSTLYSQQAVDLGQMKSFSEDLDPEQMRERRVDEFRRRKLDSSRDELV